ncbi:hypothetical protein, partial [uncultured Sutterella sp.]|uniref:hypothetical protein n=1 Tax=uncultured Sutterella sp. TaxID=286133 RepID=UPI00266F68B7
RNNIFQTDMFPLRLPSASAWRPSKVAGTDQLRRGQLKAIPPLLKAGGHPMIAGFLPYDRRAEFRTPFLHPRPK